MTEADCSKARYDRRMRVIGLTGGIATGKSTVATLLADHGASVIDADAVAREVVVPGSPALAEITSRFGSAVIGEDGSLDRKALAAIVFSDDDARRDLEAITHPRILTRMAKMIGAAAQSEVPLVVVDIPLLFENSRESEFDGVLVVVTDEATQLQRGAVRDGDVVARVAAQLPIATKRDRATWVIDNSGDRADTARQVDEWWHDNVSGRASP